MPNLLPDHLAPYAKAIYPFAATLVGVAVTWAFTGEFDQQETRTAVLGLALTLLSFLVPNENPEPDPEPRKSRMTSDPHEWPENP